MAGEFDATIDATVAGGEAATEGKYPWEWSVEEIAIAAAQAGGTAYCTAVGLGPAAPLCGMLAAEVMDWAMDNIIGPIGGAFADLFDPGTEPPRLIQRDACNRGPYLTGMMDDYFTSFLLNPIGIHSRLGLPGRYQHGEAMWSMGVRGLELPRRHSYTAWDPVSTAGRLIENAPFPPDFSAEYAIYMDVRMRELEGSTTSYLQRGNPLFGTTDQYVQVPLSEAEKCSMILNEFEDGRIQTWIDHFQRLLAEEIANLIEVAIAMKIQSTALELAMADPNLIGNRSDVLQNVSIASRINVANIAGASMDSQLDYLATAKEPEPEPEPARKWPWVVGAGVVGAAGVGWYFSARKAA